jgi:LemA protein
MKQILIGVLVVGLIIGGFLWSSYNSLVTANETVDNQWAQVEAQYQRRFDLIPNLVEAVKGAMAQEQAVFGGIAEARTRYAGAVSANEKAAAATEMEGALSRLLVVMENYPQLLSSNTVQTLMSQLEGTENRISVERGRYNDAVKVYNLKIKTIPSKWFADSFGFAERNYFEAVAASAEAPKVDLMLD